MFAYTGTRDFLKGRLLNVVLINGIVQTSPQRRPHYVRPVEEQVTNYEKYFGLRENYVG